MHERPSRMHPRAFLPVLLLGPHPQKEKRFSDVLIVYFHINIVSTVGFWTKDENGEPRENSRDLYPADMPAPGGEPPTLSLQWSAAPSG